MTTAVRHAYPVLYNPVLSHNRSLRNRLCSHISASFFHTLHGVLSRHIVYYWDVFPLTSVVHTFVTTYSGNLVSPHTSIRNDIMGQGILTSSAAQGLTLQSGGID